MPSSNGITQEFVEWQGPDVHLYARFGGRVILLIG
jgi:hypothetical protein